MPSHTAASALIKLWSFDGAPWKWRAWQARTNIKYGLFPPDDRQLPPGFSREDAINVESYFIAYNALSNEEDKIKFATKTKGGAAYPGRRIWNNFVTRNWGRWGLHTVIVTELKDANIHPQDILIREPGVPWPVADSYVPVILDSLGLKLFGEEAFPDDSDILPTDLRLCLKIIVQRSWGKIRQQLSALKSRAATIEKNARDAFQELEAKEEKPLKSQVNKTIRAVAKWKECAEVLNTSSHVATANEMLGALQNIMESLGAKIARKRRIESGETKALCKVSAQALRDLASAEDVTDLLNTYREYFEMDAEEDAEPPIPATIDSPHISGKDIDEDGDLGMEIEAKMSPKALTKALGFRMGLPPSFNTYRSRSGSLSWDFDGDTPTPTPEDLEEIKLHWHQLAGVHSIIRHVFIEGEGVDFVPGMLVGDEVGLGKMAQAITTMALLNQIIYAQKNKLECPPVVAARPFFLGLREVPSLPHLILCPGTLVVQWINELKVFFLPRSVDILVYDSKVDGTHFWGPSGPLHSSVHEPYHRIVIATHSAVFTDFRNKHKKLKTKNARPWNIPPPLKQIEGSIFEQSFLTIIIDEAHHMRVPGNNHLAALRLVLQANMRLIMTATPLHTAPRDIASMGRLVGIPHFLDEVSFIEEKQDASILRRVKKCDDDGVTFLSEQLKIVRRLQTHCQEYFLRRSPTSVDFQGQILLPLPPYHEIIGIVDLTARELTIIQERAKAAKAMMLNAPQNGIRTRNFYLEYRLAVGYAKDDADSLWPTFRSLEEWEPVKSTKMEILAQICAHYLSHDDVKDVIFEDGRPVFPPTPEVTDAKTQKTRRIIVYGEFPSMAPLLQNVLKLYDIETLAIHGEVSFQLRAKRVKDFVNPQHPVRVLIFSSVGGVGLNLSVADVVIFFDQPWSAQDVRQIRGRAHRQPQQKEVKSIHILANDSSDPLMHAVACGKHKLYDAFVNKGLGEDVRALLQGQIPDEFDENEAEGIEDSSQIEPNRKPRKSKRRTNAAAVKGDEGGIPSTSNADASTRSSEGDGPTDSVSSAPPPSTAKDDLDPSSPVAIPKPRRKVPMTIISDDEVTGSPNPVFLPPEISLSSNPSKSDDPRPHDESNPGGINPSSSMLPTEQSRRIVVDDNADMTSWKSGRMSICLSDGEGLSDGIPAVSDYTSEPESSEGFLTSALSEDGDLQGINDAADKMIIDTRSSPDPPPPPKRARHGTIGEEGRTNILAASNQDAIDTFSNSPAPSAPVISRAEVAPAEVKSVVAAAVENTQLNDDVHRAESAERRVRANNPFARKTARQSHPSMATPVREIVPPPSSQFLPRRSLPMNPPAHEPPPLKWGQQSDDPFIPRGRLLSTPHPRYGTLPSEVRSRLESYNFPESSQTAAAAPHISPEVIQSPLEASTPPAVHTEPLIRRQASGGSRVPPKSALKGHREKGKKRD